MTEPLPRRVDYHDIPLVDAVGRAVQMVTGGGMLPEGLHHQRMPLLMTLGITAARDLQKWNSQDFRDEGDDEPSLMHRPEVGVVAASNAVHYVNTRGRHGYGASGIPGVGPSRNPGEPDEEHGCKDDPEEMTNYTFLTESADCLTGFSVMALSVAAAMSTALRQPHHEHSDTCPCPPGSGSLFGAMIETLRSPLNHDPEDVARNPGSALLEASMAAVSGVGMAGRVIRNNLLEGTAEDTAYLSMDGRSLEDIQARFQAAADRIGMILKASQECNAEVEVQLAERDRERAWPPPGQEGGGHAGAADVGGPDAESGLPPHPEH